MIIWHYHNPPAPWGHQAARVEVPISRCPISFQSDVLSAEVNVQMSDVAIVDSRTEDWRSFRVCPGIQNLIFPSLKKRLWISCAPTQVCWPWCHNTCTNTNLMAWSYYGAPNHVPAQLCWSWCVQNHSVVLFDLPKPGVFKGCQTKKQNSHRCPLFDLLKPMV